MRQLTQFALLVVVMLLFSFNKISAQHHICGTDHYYEHLSQEQPQIWNRLDSVWSISDGPLEQNRSTRNNHIIPVVVHVIHDGDVGNISYEQVEDGIAVLNEDFRRTNADASSTRPEFQSVAADSEIEFRLATIDPNGDCTNGVVRVDAAEFTYNANNNVKSLSNWPSDMYLNVWLVESIQNFTGSGGIILGYAQFPGSGSWFTYGIVQRNDRWGRIGTSNSDGRTATHEVGHCLNLLHTFQGGCESNCASTGDRVCDTPPTAQATYNCNLNQNTCSNDAAGPSAYNMDVADQIQNYMSYDDCQNLFTLGQKARMKNVLNTVSTLVNLTSQQNLIATGTADTARSLCKAEFDADKFVVCAGDQVNFEDKSFFNVNSRSWTFEGGFPQQSNDEAPSVVYTTPGTYDVTLEVSDGSSTVSTTEQAIIRVLPSPGDHAPFTESFEFERPAIDEGWFLETRGQYGWEVTSAAAYSGDHALQMVNFANTADTKYEAISPNYDLSNMETATLSFKYAYAQRSTSSTDILRVYVSGNCGESWSLRYAAGGSQLTTIPNDVSPAPFVPGNTEWQEASFTISPSFFSDNVRFLFELQTNDGNNLYIDDINLSGTFSTQPILLSPEDGADNVAINTTLDWKATGPVDSYEIHVDSVITFNSPWIIAQSKSWLGYDPNQTDTELDVSGLELGKTYYWRVRTYSATDGYSPWSPLWSFEVTRSSTGLAAFQGTDALQLDIYPNPVASGVELTLRLTSLKSSRGLVEIYALDGARVHAENLSIQKGRNAHKIQPEELAPGMYLVAVRTDEMLETLKLVISE